MYICTVRLAGNTVLEIIPDPAAPRTRPPILDERTGAWASMDRPEIARPAPIVAETVERKMSII